MVMDMSNPTTTTNPRPAHTLRVVRVENVRWTMNGQVHGFATSSPLYGVADETGAMLSFSGKEPVSYDRKSTATILAAGGLLGGAPSTWITAA